MAHKVRTVGVLTSGGDAPGMNAAIRAVVRTALSKGLNVRGIRRGYQGLLNEEIINMNARDVSDIIHRGGTILQTARCAEMRTEEGQIEAAGILRKYGIDGLVVVGGDGSFAGAQKLANLGINTIGIPGTIDLDIACTEYTIGFDTAVDAVSLRLWAVTQDGLRSGADSQTEQSGSSCRKSTTMTKMRSWKISEETESAENSIISLSMLKESAIL